MLLVFRYLCSHNHETMRHRSTKYTLEQLSGAICEATGLNSESLFSRHKDAAHTTARGVFFMLAREHGHLFQQIGAYTHRHHSTIVNVSQRFQGYYETKDKSVCRLAAAVENILSNNSQHLI